MKALVLKEYNKFSYERYRNLNMVRNFLCKLKLVPYAAVMFMGWTVAPEGEYLPVIMGHEASGLSPQ